MGIIAIKLLFVNDSMAGGFKRAIEELIDKRKDMWNNVLFKSFLFMDTEITEDEVDVVHLVSHIGPDTDADSGEFRSNVGIEAFYAVISRVAPLFSDSNGAEWQGDVIVNDDKITQRISFIKIEESTCDDAGIVVKRRRFHEQDFFSVNTEFGDAGAEFIDVFPERVVLVSEVVQYQEPRVVSGFCVLSIRVALSKNYFHL